MANEKRLIDANALIAEYDRVHIGPAGGARKLMEDAPTVDAVEVVHGRWENIRFITTGDGRAKVGDCSSCKSIERVRNYCPNCGAKMDGDRDG